MTYEQAMKLMQDLHDSEINGGISWTYDSFYEWFIHNGAPNPTYIDVGDASSLLSAIIELGKAAIKLYPDSQFAKEYAGVI